MSSGRLPGAFWAGFPTHFQATRGDRDAPYSNRRRGRVAPEQGYRLALGLACFRSLPRHRARELRKRRTRNSRLSLVVLCLASSRRCLCSSPRLLRRLRCLRLSLLTRFPFLDSQVSVLRCFSMFFRTPSIFQKMQHLPHENLVFCGPGGPKMAPKWLPKCFENQALVREASGRASGSDLGRFLEAQEAPQRLPRGSQERPGSARRAPGGSK